MMASPATRIASLVAAAVLAAGGLLAPAGPAQAQGTVKTVFDDWQIRCDQPPGARDEQCALIQNVTAEDRDNVGLSVIIVKTADKKTPILRVLAPLGVLLPSGLGLRIDDKDIGRTAFVRCLANGCFAEAVMEEDLMNQMSTGSAATFIIFQTPEEGIGIPISLKGFKEGVAALP
ncbi:invasion associated locus B family protein [Methylobrevis pamukkalensis]|uniref:Invasion associated locus B (IalB) protein n=1 Tax=Methylobrevis pamukkalensis TaxID=1439726 RepID=A0A1E3H5L4_9HYPH|nr:invasion associated locus B family protein [Methylobrevis pamukkalensis]ODN71628.1 Invasion associated locus B (IalB) protein [Methylobrevis pamukkalensis]